MDLKEKLKKIQQYAEELPRVIEHAFHEPDLGEDQGILETVESICNNILDILEQE